MPHPERFRRGGPDPKEEQAKHERLLLMADIARLKQELGIFSPEELAAKREATEEAARPMTALEKIQAQFAIPLSQLPPPLPFFGGGGGEQFPFFGGGGGVPQQPIGGVPGQPPAGGVTGPSPFTTTPGGFPTTPNIEAQRAFAAQLVPTFPGQPGQPGQGGRGGQPLVFEGSKRGKPEVAEARATRPRRQIARTGSKRGTTNGQI